MRRQLGIALLFTWALTASPRGAAQSEEWPIEWKPFVKLGYEAVWERYRDPVVERNQVRKRGVLVQRRFVDLSLGSGSVITADGLILTNFHVYGWEGELQLDPESGDLIRLAPASNEMRVYELDANDPRKAPVLKYYAEPVSVNPELDVALLRIVKDADKRGMRQAPVLDYVELHNPYDVPDGGQLLMVGYPAKGGERLTRTKGDFLGYTEGVEWAIDGSIYTDGALAGGNSGGAALFRRRLIGVPSRVSPAGMKGTTYGYIHPVTWAASTFAEAALRYGLRPPGLSLEWVTHRENTDVAAEGVFLGGWVYAAQQQRPIEGATVVFHRDDYRFEAVDALIGEIRDLVLIQKLRELHRQGVTPEQLAERFELSVEQVRALLELHLDESSLSSDARLLLQGEFFFSIATTEGDGFFMVDVPRDRRLSVWVGAGEAYRPFRGSVQAKPGNVWQNGGRVTLYAR